ncbi:hypothetical protein GCM10022286_16650 [Gryllotalpicola daejeonensis]|uniref:Uncharacterized protein n=1 Tax=Gryllotalpicola daejeonensis TaxID=993087 RepID=A0ABP7ZJP9_9MICO
MATAGHSSTPQWKKLGIKAGSRVALVGAPTGWAIASEDDLPEFELVESGEPQARLAAREPLMVGHTGRVT